MKTKSILFVCMVLCTLAGCKKNADEPAQKLTRADYVGNYSVSLTGKISTVIMNNPTEFAIDDLFKNIDMTLSLDDKNENKLVVGGQYATLFSITSATVDGNGYIQFMPSTFTKSLSDLGVTVVTGVVSLALSNESCTLNEGKLVWGSSGSGTATFNLFGNDQTVSATGAVVNTAIKK